MVEDDAINCVVRELNAISRSATLHFALSVGKLIVDRFYGGEVARWRERDPGKLAPLRKIARHPELPMNPATLYRSLAIYELTERLGIFQWKHVSATHVRVVLPLTPDEQDRLLSAAESGSWSVRRLESEIDRCRTRFNVISSRGGRKRGSPLTVAIRDVDKCASLLETVLHTDSVLEVEMSPEVVQAAIDSVQRALDVCTTLNQRLFRLLPGALSTAPPPEAAVG